MLKKIITSLLLLVSIEVFSNDQFMYQIDQYNFLYEDIKMLNLSLGEVLVSSSFPMSGSEIRFMLNGLSKKDLSSGEEQIVERIYSVINRDNEGFTHYLDMTANLETYLNIDNENKVWVYDYHSRKPLFNLSTGFGIENFYWCRVDLPIQKGMDFNEYPQSETNLSLLWNTNQMDIQFPFTALSSVGGKNWNLSFGRDLLSYGLGETGNLILSSDATFHDYLRVSTFWNKFKYTFTVLNIEAIDLGEGFTSYGLTEDKSIDRTRVKILIDHNFEFKPLKNLSIALHESVIRGGTEITLPFFNPFMVLHNLALQDKTIDTVMGNSMLSLAVNYTPIKRLNIYGEFALDQLETPSEAERLGDEAGNGDPNAYGYLFGIKYLVNLKYSLVLKGEYALTNPHLYRSDKSWAVYSLARYYHNLYGDSNDIEWEPLGYKEGPDSQVVMLSAQGSFFNRKLDLKLDYYNILKGEGEISKVAETGKEAAKKNTPSGSNVFKRNILNLDVSYGLLENLDVYTNISFLYFNNYEVKAGEYKDITDLQFVLGVSYSL